MRWPFLLSNPQFIAPLVAVLLLSLTLAARLVRRARAVPTGAWIEVDLGGSVSELGMHVPRLRRLLSRDPSVRSAYALRRVLERAGKDPRVTGVLFRIEALSCGWSTAMALREAIATVRAAGKRAVAFLPAGAGTRELYVASAAEKIITTPQGSIAPIGVSSGQTFFTKLLARGGIEAEVLARREYKSAAESFVREGYSPENRAQLEALLDAAATLIERFGLPRSEPLARAGAVSWATRPEGSAHPRGVVFSAGPRGELGLRFADLLALPRPGGVLALYAANPAAPERDARDVTAERPIARSFAEAALSQYQSGAAFESAAPRVSQGADGEPDTTDSQLVRGPLRSYEPSTRVVPDAVAASLRASGSLRR